MIAAIALGLLTLAVDLRDVPRAIVHGHTIVDTRGRVTLVYPKWVPGTHAPSGPLGSLASLVVRSGGRVLPWHRDSVDTYAFHVDAPANAPLDVSYDVTLTPGQRTTSKLGIFEWTHYLLYPQGSDIRTLPVVASVTLPAGWDAASALEVARRDGARVTYAQTTLERVGDSPLLAGAYMQTIPLAGGDAPVSLAIASGLPSPAIDPKVVDHFKTLLAQAQLLFGARHWRHYTFLFTLSDEIGFGGVEHGESSWNGVPQDGLSSEREAKHTAGYLLAHEFTHSWNGKYRRPAGLTRSDFQAPYETDLLWFYEGLTQYLGDVLATRSGFYDENEFATIIANKAAALEVEPGRLWRPLVDTAVAEDKTRSAPGEWTNQRRGVEYYFEGELLWMEADALIRAGTKGTRSLDDFVRAFFGGSSTGPLVVPYARADVVAAMNVVYPYDWSSFFAQRVERIARHVPLALESAGWRVAYDATPSDYAALVPVARVPRGPDLRYSIGAVVAADGAFGDVLVGSAAERAGLAPGMKIVAIEDRAYSSETLRAALERAQKGGSIKLLVESPDGVFSRRTVRCDGPRYPRAERDSTKPDLAAAIVAPLH